MIINIVFTFISATFESNILANEQFIFQQIRQMMQSILLPILTVPILYFFHKNLVVVVIIQTFITILNLIANVYFCIKILNMRFSFKTIELSFVKEIGTFSFFIFLNQIFNQINDSTPVYMLGILKNTQQVAIYSIVNQLKSLFLTFSQVLTTIFIPKVNHLVNNSDNNTELDNLMIKIGQYQILILGFF
ncbi:MAG: oligosaccharide flippase family protein [Enterococcus lacertideformus]|uniref:Oligosaccharide flippase family protein n=1 Tax=Enterococcus lacertideformus TaxID=2771493 RepID=A0A931B0W0_9ENTE|nr:oligosaccharide flippase family protein [Enterococcus lacertideformus]